MIKFVSVLITVMSLNFAVVYTTTEFSQKSGIDVEFSNDAIKVESGQPVFSKDTKVTISNPTNKSVKLYLNEEEKEISKGMIELDRLEEGTYTLMVIDAENSKSTFGFTIE